MTRIIGADPGLHGALALIDTERWIFAVKDMPCEPGKAGRSAVSPVGVAKLFDEAVPDYAFIEDVHSMPAQGIASAFSFGRSLGILLGACSAFSVLTMVSPVAWKRATNTPRDKNQARRRAQQLFPSGFEIFSRVKDDGRAEAAILAFYGLLTLKLTPPRALALRSWEDLL